MRDKKGGSRAYSREANLCQAPRDERVREDGILRLAQMCVCVCVRVVRFFAR